MEDMERDVVVVVVLLLLKRREIPAKDPRSGVHPLATADTKDDGLLGL